MAKSHITPVQAIRAKCLDCCAGSFKEVRLCPLTWCPIHPFRLGKNPNYKLKTTLTPDLGVKIQKPHESTGVFDKGAAAEGGQSSV